jgi:hypothetical protein
MQPPGHPDREVADEQVHDAVGDQPDACDVGEDRVIGDRPGALDDAVHPIEQRAGGGHGLIVRDRIRRGDRERPDRAYGTALRTGVTDGGYVRSG